MRCRNYQWRQWQAWFARRLAPRQYSNTSRTHAVTRTAVFRSIYCKFVTYIVKLFGHDWAVSYTQSFCCSLSPSSLLWLFVRMARVRSFDHIYVCIRWPQVSQHLLSFITLAVTGWHSDSSDIKHGTSQPRRIVYVAWRGYCVITHTFCSLATRCSIQHRLGNYSYLSEYNIPPETWVNFSLGALVFVFVGTWALAGRAEDKRGCVYSVTKLVNLRHLRFVPSLLAFNC
jgi:hypothetical protein